MMLYANVYDICLSSLFSIPRFLCKADTNLVSSFENSLYPTFQLMLGMESCVEFISYIFQIMSQLFELRVDVPQTYQALFPGLLLPSWYDNTGNAPAMVKFLQLYIYKHAYPTLLTDERLEGVLGIFQKLLVTSTTERFGMELVNTIIEEIPLNILMRNNAGKPSYIQLIFQLIFTRLQNKRTHHLLRSTILLLSTFINKHGGDNLIAALNSIQSNIFAMLVEKVWYPNMDLIVQDVDKKNVSLALTRLLRTPNFHQPPYTPLIPLSLLHIFTILAPANTQPVGSPKAGSGTVVEGAILGQAEDPDDFLVSSTYFISHIIPYSAIYMSHILCMVVLV